MKAFSLVMACFVFYRLQAANDDSFSKGLDTTTSCLSVVAVGMMPVQDATTPDLVTTRGSPNQMRSAVHRYTMAMDALLQNAKKERDQL